MKPLTGIAVFLAAQLLLDAAPPALAAGAQNDRPAPGKSQAHATLLSLERQRASAILRRDIPTLRALMDRHYYHVDSRGRARSKTELLTALERDDFRFRIYDIESAEIQLLDGGNAAVVAGIFRTQQAVAKARPFRARYIHVWVHQPDGWKTTFHQSTEIRPAQEGCPCD